MKMKLALALTTEFRPALVLAVVQQVATGLFLMALGEMYEGLLQIWAFALLAFWAGVVVVALRRPSRPTHTDILFIKFGFIPLCIGAAYLANLIWDARGVL